MMNKWKIRQAALPMSEHELDVLRKRIGAALGEKKIIDLEKQFDERHKAVKMVNPGIWKAAALWVCLISLPLLALLCVTGSDKSLFNRYYSPYDVRQVAGIYRGLASEMYTPYYLYGRSDYSAALPLFRQYLEVNPADGQARLLLAVCMMESRDFGEAEAELKRILLSENFFFQDEARWYLSLLAVRKGQFTEARDYLRNLDDSSRYTSLVLSLEKKIAGKLSL